MASASWKLLRPRRYFILFAVIERTSTMAELSPNSHPAAKRQRKEPIYDLCQKQQWREVTDRVLAQPDQALVKSPQGSTPLAFACRSGAPASCVKVLLDAAPETVRVLLPSRGTPLHEAIVCELVGVVVIQLLLQVDEKLEGSTRAALMQDVDGHTPLHLLIRRRSPSHILMVNNSHWMPLFEMLVKSCPEASGIPDSGEYEEPPLVMALKANQYAATSADSESDDVIYPRIEMRIHEMVQIMLRHYPAAASRVLEGARGQYTALHSAVFHGRCSDTIQLLLQAEEKTSDKLKAALLANTQGEIPLHFAAMRGEPPRTIGLLGNAAPMAVLQRDTSGLTPLHWLWIRFVSTVLSLDDRQLTRTVVLEPRALEDCDYCSYSKFWHVERGDFSTDLILMRRIDPPLDFFRMRHIPPELCDNRSSNLSWAERAVEVLATMRDRDREHGYEHGHNTAAEWTREEAVTCLFWVKVVSLLKAFSKTQHDEVGDFHLVHTAMSSPSCPPAVAHITSLLFPEELAVRDSYGCFPLHHAAKREWYSFDWRNEENDAAASKLLQGESLELLNNVIRATPSDVTRVVDNGGRLVLHHVIETFVSACSRCRVMSSHKDVVASMLETLKDIVQQYPESLERRDGQTKLYPFLQATASATTHRSQPSPNGFPVPSPDEMPLSIVYMLLRENPLLVSSAAVS